MTRILHGRPSGYTYHGCRCDLCREAWRVRQNAYNARRRDGVPVPSRTDIARRGGLAVQKAGTGHQWTAAEAAAAGRLGAAARWKRKPKRSK